MYISGVPGVAPSENGVNQPISTLRADEYYCGCSMQMLIVSRLSVLVFALFSGVWSIILIRIGIDINWLFFVIGLLVASVFPPISFLLTWNAVPKVRLLACVQDSDNFIHQITLS